MYDSMYCAGKQSIDSPHNRPVLHDWIRPLHAQLYHLPLI